MFFIVGSESLLYLISPECQVQINVKVYSTDKVSPCGLRLIRHVKLNSNLELASNQQY